jgi:hypothetical protein
MTTETAVGDLAFDIRRSVRYHDRRRVHFERLHRLTNVTTILLAGVVLMELGGEGSPTWVRVLAAAGALIGAVDLVVGFSRRADTHHNFKRRFIALEQELDAATPDLEKIRQQRLAIEAEEPPIYRALDLLCHNELCAAMGYDRRKQPEAFSSLPWYQRWTANWIHWHEAGNEAAKTSSAS